MTFSEHPSNYDLSNYDLYQVGDYIYAPESWAGAKYRYLITAIGRFNYLVLQEYRDKGDGDGTWQTEGKSEMSLELDDVHRGESHWRKWEPSVEVGSLWERHDWIYDYTKHDQRYTDLMNEHPGDYPWGAYVVAVEGDWVITSVNKYEPNLRAFPKTAFLTAYSYVGRGQKPQGE